MGIPAQRGGMSVTGIVDRAGVVVIGAAGAAVPEGVAAAAMAQATAGIAAGPLTAVGALTGVGIAEAHLRKVVAARMRVMLGQRQHKPLRMI